jgi:hypothetical protein
MTVRKPPVVKQKAKAKPEKRHVSKDDSVVRPRVLAVIIAIALVMFAVTAGIRMMLTSSPEAPLLVANADTRQQSLPSVSQQPDQKSAPMQRNSGPDSHEPKQPKSNPVDAAPVDDVADADQADKPEELIGIHVFPPLGTKPAHSGIIVPEDFELPPGYVRHYQSSDDGKQLVPILMYHPTRPPLDWRGEPIEIPPDRIVPPEMAPDGLPVQILEVPETQDTSMNLQRLLNAGHSRQ